MNVSTAPIRIGDFVMITNPKTGVNGHCGYVEKVNNLTAEVVVAVRRLRGPKVFAHKRFDVKDVEITECPQPVTRTQICKCCGKPL